MEPLFLRFGDKFFQRQRVGEVNDAMGVTWLTSVQKVRSNTGATWALVVDVDKSNFFGFLDVSNRSALAAVVLCGGIILIFTIFLEYLAKVDSLRAMVKKQQIDTDKRMSLLLRLWAEKAFLSILRHQGLDVGLVLRKRNTMPPQDFQQEFEKAKNLLSGAQVCV
jgi:hypothetical protein